MFLHLLRRNPDHKLTVKQLVNLLKPEFSPEGSNSRSLENKVYAAFVKYMREVASKYSKPNIHANITTERVRDSSYPFETLYRLHANLGSILLWVVSTDISTDMSTDMSVDGRSICRSIVDR